jgi:Ca-activated chloride channel family protein
MEIHARFTQDKLDHSQDNIAHLVVTLQAPALDWVTKRPKVCVLPVIDLSGSMQGDKLIYAKRSAQTLIEHLQPGDVAGLAMFHDFAKVVVAPAEVTAEHKERLKRAIEGLSIGGGTNFADGLIQAVEVIQKLDLAPSYLHRVIMFTDGQPTVGVTDNRAILKMLKGKRGRATISAFGYGDVGGGVWNGCDQDFLGELATLGEGNYAYVKDPDEALAAFGKELGGLLSTYATNLLVEIETAGGHQVKRVVTDVEHEEDVTGKIEIPIPSILSEETRHLVFEVALAKQKNAFPRQTNICDVQLRYSVLTESGSRESNHVGTKAKVRFVKPDEAQREPHKDLDKIVALHQTIRAQLEAEKQADQGNYQEAARHVQLLSEDIAARGHENLAGVAQQMCFYLADANQYAGSAGYRRSFARGGTRAYANSAMDQQATSALLSCDVSVSNSAMEQMGQAFSVQNDAGVRIDTPQGNK